MDKNLVYAFAKKMRYIAKRFNDMGTSGDEGGVDGEMSSPGMLKVLNAVSTQIVLKDQKAFGIDIGSGSGVACMAYFNKFTGLPMIGVESNYQRCFTSWRLQEELLRNESHSEFRDVARMSKFIYGDGFQLLIDLFGACGENAIFHLKLIYWFRRGWSEKDIIDVIYYACRSFANLEYIICDMTAEKLQDYGFMGTIISTVQFCAQMSNSSCSRTLYVHNVTMNLKVNQPISDHEMGVLDFFNPAKNISTIIREVQEEQRLFYVARSGTRSGACTSKQGDTGAFQLIDCVAGLEQGKHDNVHGLNEELIDDNSVSTIVSIPESCIGDDFGEIDSDRGLKRRILYQNAFALVAVESTKRAKPTEVITNKVAQPRLKKAKRTSHRAWLEHIKATAKEDFEKQFGDEYILWDAEDQIELLNCTTNQ